MVLGRRELAPYARALAHCWQRVGVKAGDRVLIFDYGSSPTSLLASALYAPLLRRGAAEELGCLPICNDGVASMAPRAVQLLGLLRPAVVFARADVLPAFAAAVEERDRSLLQSAQALVVCQEEGLLAPAQRERFAEALGVPIYRLLRLDLGCFLAVECLCCALFHTWPDLYRVSEERGLLAIAPRFAQDLGRYVSSLAVDLVGAGCPQAPTDLRLRIIE